MIGQAHSRSAHDERATSLDTDVRPNTPLAGRLPIIPNWSAIERQAQRFADPIESLRYLRQATGSPAARRSLKIQILPVAVAVAILCLRSDAIPRPSPAKTPPTDPVPQPILTAKPTSKPSKVWPVEQNSNYDLYSNGLRVENTFAVSNLPRSYRSIARGSGQTGPLRTQPAGIVFHTTESDVIAFEPQQTPGLQRIGKELLQFVRAKRAYHFVIDRFGRVYRIVVESDAANHAGPSAWADSQWSYVELNSSFLGVAFEARMQDDPSILTEGQIRSGRALTEMLRAKYNVPAEDCVVHAQISVNPSNWRIGLHADWGFGFPFREIGLPDNYRIPNPNIYLFGFEYDSVYTSVTGPDLWNGLVEADQRLREAAAGRRLTQDEYRRVLQQKYRQAESFVYTYPGEEN